MKSNVSPFQHAPFSHVYSLARSCAKALHGLRDRDAVRSKQLMGSPQREAVALEPACPVSRLAVSLLLNGCERWIPTQFAASSTWTGLCQAAQMVRDTGGFESRSLSRATTTAQIGLPGCADTNRARRRIEALGGDLLQLGMDALPEDRIPIGCIPGLRLRESDNGNLEVALHVEGDGELDRRVVAMAAHAIVAPLALLAECRGEPDIVVGVLETERVRARCRIKISHLGSGPAELPSTRSGQSERRDGTAIGRLMQKFGIDSHQPDLAAVHNAHVLEALMVAAAALGIDSAPWATEARGHAARWGSCEPLARWRKAGDELVGELCVPVDLQGVHDALRRARPANERVTLETARDIAIQVATIGLCASLAYLRAVLLASSVHAEQRGSSPSPIPRVVESRSSRRWPSGRVVSESGVHETVRAGSRTERSVSDEGRFARDQRWDVDSRSNQRSAEGAARH